MVVSWCVGDIDCEYVCVPRAAVILFHAHNTSNGAAEALNKMHMSTMHRTVQRGLIAGLVSARGVCGVVAWPFFSLCV